MFSSFSQAFSTTSFKILFHC